MVHRQITGGPLNIYRHCRDLPFYRFLKVINQTRVLNISLHLVASLNVKHDLIGPLYLYSGVPVKDALTLHAPYA